MGQKEEDSDTILLDGGSTTYELARLLVGRPLHIVTTSLPVANLFASDAGSDLVLIGGNICPRSGVCDDGFFNNDLMLVETERAMMRAAAEVIVVADSTKFGHQSLTHLCPLNAVHQLIVDDGITTEWREKVRAAGVDLIVAETNTNTTI